MKYIDRFDGLTLFKCVCVCVVRIKQELELSI